MKQDFTTKTPAELGTFIGEELFGTGESLFYTIKRFGLDEKLENDEQFCNALDEVVLCCHTCDWWCDPSEIDDRGDCKECSLDSGEEE